VVFLRWRQKLKSDFPRTDQTSNDERVSTSCEMKASCI
jgi:hypothetical protein